MAEEASQRTVEFLLSSLWTWRPDGRERVLSWLNGCNLQNAFFWYDPGPGWFRVRCLEKDKRYVQKKYLDLQSQIENELKVMDLVNPDGTLRHDINNRFVKAPSPNLAIPEDNSAKELKVPAELRNFPCVAVWQDLQPEDRVFSDGFVSKPVLLAIEHAHSVKMMPNDAYKVVFIGAASEQAANLIKKKLTTLLHYSKISPMGTRHVFLAEAYGMWTVDVRTIDQINPILAPSTILDPLEFNLPEKYDVLLGQAFCLRACREEPPLANAWSIFGPRVGDVFRNEPPRRRSRFFVGIEQPQKYRGQIEPHSTHGQSRQEETKVEKWLSNMNGTGNATPEIDMLIPDLTTNLRTIAMDAVGGDDPVPLGQVHVPHVKPEAVIPMKVHSTPTRHEAESLLDQVDPALQESTSTLQRALQPDLRTILAVTPKNGFVGQASCAPPQQYQEIDQPWNFDNLKSLMKRTMGPLRMEAGAVRVCAQFGRYYLDNVEGSGTAKNGPKEPANGWVPGDLVRILENDVEKVKNFFFTRILSYWANDVDYLASMEISGEKIWERKDRGTFLDFHFSASTSSGMRRFVLEVDGSDFSWMIHETEDTCNLRPIYVHCLARHWDFRMVVSRDRTIDLNHNYGAFARQLVDSLALRRPTLEFQDRFDDQGISVEAVRIRQVCRFQNQNQKTLLTITRVMPTMQIKKGDGPQKYRTVTSLSEDDVKNGVFSQWFEASISSARLNEFLMQNEKLVPGDETDWTVEQLVNEGVFEAIYGPAAEMVKQMDGVGVKCDNIHALRQTEGKARRYESYYF